MFLRFLSLFTRRRIHIAPPAVLALLYACLIAGGSVLLKLPLASRLPVSWADAIFTATSAVTVTGLAVLDTGSDFTLFGQIVILMLIQLGGLGLMTFAVLILAMLGLPVGLPHRIFLREDLNQTSLTGLLQLVALIARVVLAFELIGSLLLALVFVPEFGWWQGLWQSVFHAVSAFNNAGFSLFSDSLTGWASSPLVNLTVTVLIIMGGIGFSVLSDLRSKRQWRHFSLHSKLMLSGTAALILWSVPVFAALEWNNPDTLGQFDSGWVKLMVSWFQGITVRTAGFNSIDMSAMHDSTALMFISLMVIGGGSTSTAGGIKVTTFIVLILATLAFFRRRSTLHVFGRSLGHEEVLKVLALGMVSLLLVMFCTFVISMSHDGNFLNLAFEVASAFGTVGLSRGTTAELDALGRGVIILLMFIGRVGPLTLGFFLATRTLPRVRYPAGNVLLG
ncbi:MAG: TrkH family potassium uptake protein [Pseudomonadales bacterium]|nr:TrkH family potassium uptake protein [Pseudomonadales bacterium]